MCHLIKDSLLCGVSVIASIEGVLKHIAARDLEEGGGEREDRKKWVWEREKWEWNERRGGERYIQRCFAGEANIFVNQLNHICGRGWREKDTKLKKFIQPLSSLKTHVHTHTRMITHEHTHEYTYPRILTWNWSTLINMPFSIKLNSLYSRILFETSPFLT